MAKYSIKDIHALEILDSRGNPTLRVFVTLKNGIKVGASVPSGASTGENEAVELRDGDMQRYKGKGVKKAMSNVIEIIAPELVGMDVHQQVLIDQKMINLDGTVNKSHLGANAILGVSMAVAKAAAEYENVDLFRYLGGSNARRLPVPCMNILNGGEHADNSVDFQEFMAIPHGAPSFSEGLRYVAETFHTLKGILKKRGLATSVGDEGGFAPNLGSNEEAIELIIEAIEKSGYKPGEDISIGIDSAASAFSPTKKDRYVLSKSNTGTLSTEEMLVMIRHWVRKYPIILWEDPFGEDDWAGFAKMTRELGSGLEIVGDDIFVTNVKFIQRGIEKESANASLIKLNQIGTVTETIDAVRLCRDHGWRSFLSHRSGETSDTFLADFAVAMDSGHLKSGSACRSERLAKYNRLLEIEDMLGDDALYYWR